MNISGDEPSNLSYDYVFNHVFKKLSDTFDKYRHILPPVSEVEQAIIASQQDDPFLATIHILDMLRTHSAESELIGEIFDNIRRDMWHGIDPEKVAPHEGDYYIASVAD